MLSTRMAVRGMVVAPHHLASEAGVAVLREGGNAIEAMVAAAAAIAVVYPHMNSIGGDGFWLVHEPGSAPRAIDACGAAAAQATPELYRQEGCQTIPARGRLAANTVAGTVSGWGEALRMSAGWGGRIGLPDLLSDAIAHAELGVPVTESQARLTEQKRAEMGEAAGFASTYLSDGRAPRVGERFRQPRLGATLRRLAAAGTDDFYRGELAGAIATDLERAGSPVSRHDLAQHRALAVAPLSVRIADATLYNLPPPTQGLASLAILAAFDRLGVDSVDDTAYLHALVECTKQAFLVRDRDIEDPRSMVVAPAELLAEDRLDALAAAVDPGRALPWPPASAVADAGDTVWLGAIDGEGRAVSFIQSLYWEFGSGVVLQDTGITWQNRGASFRLEAGRNQLRPGAKPFHTLNPALARFDDGRIMAYGTMGGEGQPQTQAAVFTRYARHGQDLQQAVSAPRWLLGRTWGAETTTLKLESRFPAELLAGLRALGHEVEVVAAFDEMMGHAGALVRHSDGLIEGAADPRSDGAAIGW